MRWIINKINWRKPTRLIWSFVILLFKMLRGPKSENHISKLNQNNLFFERLSEYSVTDRLCSTFDEIKETRRIANIRPNSSIKHRNNVQLLSRPKAICRENRWLLFFRTRTRCAYLNSWPTFLPISTIESLSLSGACQEDVAASTSVRHAGLSQARRLADARPKLSGRRSSSRVL